jgi:hypothetical protein
VHSRVHTQGDDVVRYAGGRGAGGGPMSAVSVLSKALLRHVETGRDRPPQPSKWYSKKKKKADRESNQPFGPPVTVLHVRASRAHTERQVSGCS